MSSHEPDPVVSLWARNLLLCAVVAAFVGVVLKFIFAPPRWQEAFFYMPFIGLVGAALFISHRRMGQGASGEVKASIADSSVSVKHEDQQHEPPQPVKMSRKRAS